MTERVPPEGPDGLPPADPTEEGLPDEQGAGHTSEETAGEKEDAERSLSNRLGAFGAGRSG